MLAAQRVDALLRKNGVDYATVRCRRANRQGSPYDRDGVAQVEGHLVARTVVLADSRGYALAVIPRDRHLDLAALENEFGRRFRVASNAETLRLFPGLPLRALPPVDAERRLETFVDQSLVPLTEVYLETTDPEGLVRLDGESFRGLFYGAWCGQISRPSR